MVHSFLFPQYANGKGVSLFLLVLRVFFGVLLMVHGYDKMSNFAELAMVFPDPAGIGSHASLVLAVFAEFFCSAAFIMGFLYRLSMIPMIVTMFTAFFLVHGGSVAGGGELAFVYLAVFLAMYVTGPGAYSADYLIGRFVFKEHQEAVIGKDPVVAAG